jgi:oligopeptide/dipeptide ABC transporter ATP-binding protein
MTVGAIIAEGMAIHGIGDRESRRRRVRELLDVVGLPARSAELYPHEFSGGQRQRIGIARALAVEPGLIIADEPVSALDVSIQAQILNLLLELKSEFGLSYLFIAHDLAVVEYVSDAVAVMYLGRIVEYARCEELYRQPAHPYTRALMASVPQVDPDRIQDFQPLEGELPNPENPPPGCPFHPRCPRAMPHCASDEPAVHDIGEAGRPHRVRCHLYAPET